MNPTDASTIKDAAGGLPPIGYSADGKPIMTVADTIATKQPSQLIASGTAARTQFNTDSANLSQILQGRAPTGNTANGVSTTTPTNATDPSRVGPDGLPLRIYISDPSKYQDKGYVYDDAKSNVPPPTTVTGGTDTNNPNNTDTVDSYTASVKELNDGYDTQYKQYQDQLDTIRANSDTANQALIDSIKKSYDTRRQQMIDTNNRRLGSKEVLGERTGDTRYASDIQGGILSDEEDSGNLRLAQLDSEEAQLVAKAKQAQTAQDYDALNKSMELLDKTRTEKEDTLFKLHQLATQETQTALKKSSEQRLSDTADLNNNLKTSKQLAPSIVANMADMSDEDKASYIEEVAREYGIPTDYLLSSVTDESQANAKDAASIENTRSIIEGRNVSQQNAAERLKQGQQRINISATKKTGSAATKLADDPTYKEALRRANTELMKGLDTGTGFVTVEKYNQVKNAWVTAGGQPKDFDAQFKKYSRI